MPSCGVCLSVCLGVCHARFFLSKLVNVFSEYLHRRVAKSCTILVFLYQALLQYFDGDPAIGASDAGGIWKKIAIFELYLALSHIVNGMRPSGVVNRVPPDRGKLVTLMAGSIKRRRLLIAGDGRRSATHQWNSCLWREASTLRRRQQQNRI